MHLYFYQQTIAFIGILSSTLLCGCASEKLLSSEQEHLLLAPDTWQSKVIENPQSLSYQQRFGVVIPEPVDIFLQTALSDNKQVLRQINEGQRQLEQYVSEQNMQLVGHIYNQVWGTRIISEIKLVPAEIRGIEIEEASDRLQAYISDIPDAEDIEFKSTLNVQEPKIGFVMRSANTESLRAALNDLKTHLAKYQGVNLIRDSMDKGSTELVFNLKPGADTLGVTLRDVSKQVKQAYFGQEVQRIAKAGGDVRVKVRYSKQERESIDTLARLNIRTRDGR